MRAAEIAIALATFLHAWLSYRPFEMQFYTDTWRWLAEFHSEGVASFWKLHFGHFLPLAKLPLYLIWRIFGMNPAPFQIAGILLHCLNAIVLFRFTRFFADSLAARVAGTLVFSLCTIPWQVIQWEAAQQIGQSMLFLLLSLLSLVRFLETNAPQWRWSIVLCGLASTLSMSFGILTLPLLPVAAFLVAPESRRTATVRGAIVLAVAIGVLFASICWIASGSLPFQGVSDEYAGTKPMSEKLPDLVRWIWMGFSEGLVRTAFKASPLIWLSLAAALVVSLAMKARRAAILALPLAMVVGNYAITGFGRIGMGMEASLNSRYQYYPLAAVALAAAWAFEGPYMLASRFGASSQSTRVRWLWTAALFGSVWYLAWVGPRHVKGASNHMAYAPDARYFIDQAVWQRTQPPTPKGMTRMGAYFLLPPALYWGPFPLDRILPLFGSGAVAIQPSGERLASALGLKAVRQYSLIESNSLVPGVAAWEEGKGVHREVLDPKSGRVRITIPPRAMLELVIEPCCRHELAYTFAVRGRVLSGTGLQLRLEFRTEDNREITSVSSASIPVADHDQVMEASGHSPEISRAVKAQFHNACWDGSTAVLEVDEVFAFRHPVFVPSESLYPKLALPAKEPVSQPPATATR